MDFLRILDEFIEDNLASGFTEEQITSFLLEEDRILYDGNTPIPISEAIHRVRRMVSGVRITTRKYGRVDPIRRQRAIRSARMHRARRLMAARKYQRSPKARRVRQVMKMRRRTMGVKRHAKPRSARTPRVGRRR